MQHLSILLPSPLLLALVVGTGTISIPSPGSSPSSTPGAVAPEDPDAIDFSGPLEDLRAKTDVPGAVVMVMEAGQVTLWGAAGFRAQGSQDPILISDPMHLGSCSKAMTSTLVARLVQQDVLDWDTTVSQALPEFAQQIDPGYRDTTIEALIKHQAGIAERRRPEIMAFHEPLQLATGSPREVRLEILAQVLSLPPSPSQPGTFDYSNFGYMAAGAMMEGLTGKSWAELMKEHLFDPLEMTTAGIGSPSGANAPVGHQLDEGTLTALPPGPGGILPESMGPAGLVHCSLADWGLFINQHLAGLGSVDHFLEPESREVLHRDHGSSGYAAGWGLRSRRWGGESFPALDHNGSDGTWLSQTTAIPELDMTIMVALNSATPGANQLMQQAMAMLLSETGFE